MENTPHLKNLIFDLGDVIIPIDLTAPLRNFAMLANLPEEEVKAIWKEHDIWNRYETGLIDDENFREHVRKVLHNRTDAPDSWADEVIDTAWNSVLLDMPVSRVERIRELGSRYRLFLLSNTNALHIRQVNRMLTELHQPTLEELFERVFYSYDVKMIKPSPDIYQHVLTEAGLLAQETAFFDDNAANIRAAGALGIQAIQRATAKDDFGVHCGFMNQQLKTYLLHGGLFLLTLVTTTMAGAEWMYGRLFIPISGMQTLGWDEFLAGLNFSIPFLAILTVHEFGHYIVARINKVRVTLPYYIPLWIGIGESIGTLGAFIRIKDYINSRRKYFDIGIAGPLAGFVLALVVLWYGFTHLPPVEYIFTIHPEYKKWGLDYGKYAYQKLPAGGVLVMGDNLLFSFFKQYVADPSLLPHPYEMVHYPYLLAGYLALFFTSLNLIPIGQLDGGHILYALIGKERFRWVAPALFIVFAFYAGLGTFKPADFAVPTDEAFFSELGSFGLYVFFMYLAFTRISEQRMTALMIALSVVALQLIVSTLQPDWNGYSGFLVFVFVLGRFLGIYHPDTELQEPLDLKRTVLGWLALVVFIISFSPKPFVIT